MSTPDPADRVAALTEELEHERKRAACAEQELAAEIAAHADTRATLDRVCDLLNTAVDQVTATRAAIGRTVTGYLAGTTRHPTHRKKDTHDHHR